MFPMMPKHRSAILFFFLLAFGSLFVPPNSKADLYRKESNSLNAETSKVAKIAVDSLFQFLATNDLNTVKNNVVSAAATELSSEAKNALLGYFPTVELDLNYVGGEIEGGALIVMPLYDYKSDVFFTQGSIFQKNDRTTINSGVGYRKLAFDESLLLGINAFYDHEFPYNHARASLGLEARTTIGELNANIYHSLSDWKFTENTIEEKALGGYDLEIGMPLPYLNWAKFYARAFEWKSAIDGVKDIGGMDVRMVMQFPFIDGLTLVAGHRDYDSQADEQFFSIAYTFELGEKKKSKRSWMNDTAYDLESMRDHRFSKVRRENLIFKQRRSSGVLLIGGF